MSNINDPVFCQIVNARVKLLIDKPFFGQLASRLIAVEAPWCNTAATDGKHLYYNREFIKQLSLPNLLFLVAHEVMHVVYDHVGRRGGRDKDVFNMACDYNINYGLVRDKVGEMPEMGLYDEAYTDEMSADEIYDLLIKNSVTIKMPLDHHMDIGQDGDTGNSPGNGGKPGNITVMGGKDGPPVLTEADIQKIRNQFRATMIQTACSVGAGNVPLGVRRLIQQLTQPQIDWRTMLDAHIRSAVKDDYTYQRLSRRSCGDAILPAQSFMDRVEITLAIDASGSTTQEMVTDFLSEAKGVMDSFTDYKIDILCFDTEVYNHKVFTPDNAGEIYEYEIKGGGGTIFQSVQQYILKNDLEPHRVAFLTDGYPNDGWGDANLFDTIFIIHSNSTNIVAPYGLTANYEPVKKRAA